MTTWAIFDVSAIFWQEFHGAARREPTVAIVGGLLRMRHLARQHGAESSCVWCHDAGPYHRTAFHPAYKSSRADDAPDKRALRELLDRLGRKAMYRAGLKNVLWSRGLEADDHAAAAVSGLPNGDRALVISRDRDLLQLVGANTSLYDPYEHRAYGRTWFRAEHLGLHPRQWADVKALTGCSTDDVPGCDGVGVKTACKYLAGELAPHTAAHAAITAFVASDVHPRSSVLVRLPWPGTPPVALERHEPVTPAQWGRVCEQLGLEGTAEHFTADRGRTCRG